MIIDYFEENWIGRIIHNIRRRPKYSFELWNCYKSVSNDLSKTNNFFEGLHMTYSEQLICSRSTIWKFVDPLKEEKAKKDVLKS